MKLVTFPPELLGTIVLEDCESAIAQLSASSVDLTVTTPPRYDKTCDYKSYLDSGRQWLKGLLRITKPGRRVVWNTSNATVGTSMLPVPHDIAVMAVKMGWLFSEEVIWHDPAVLSKWAPGSYPRGPSVRMRSSIGHLLVFRKPGHSKCTRLPMELKPYNMLDRNFFRDRVSKECWAIPQLSQGIPSSKEALVTACIRMWSRPGEIVFDPFMGTGITAISALKWKRHFFGCEREAKLRAVAEREIEICRMRLLDEELMMVNSLMANATGNSNTHAQKESPHA